MAEARHVLRVCFGHPTFAPGQEAVIRKLFTGGGGGDGRGSGLGVLPTWGGQSLCYQLPALLLRHDGATVVVEPTVALVEDQARRLAAAGIHAVALRASTPDREWAAVVAAVAAAQPRVLLTTPEVLRGLARDRLRWLSLALLLVDEAHCVLEWSSFRPDSLRLPHVAAAVGAGRVLALTATVSADDAAAIAGRFAIAPAAVVRTPYRRPNLVTAVIAVPPAAASPPGDARGAFERRLRLLLDLLRVPARWPTLVYVNARGLADRLTPALAAAALPVMANHGGLPPGQRSAVLGWFLDTLDGIVVCTCAFGMGIGKPNVRVWSGRRARRGLCARARWGVGASEAVCSWAPWFGQRSRTRAASQ